MQKPFVNWGWEDGQFFDFWSFVHILSGIILGLGVLLFKLPTGWSMLAIAVGLTLYEFLEFLGRVAEVWANIITDIVIGSLGAAGVIFFLQRIVSYHSLFLILIVCILVNLALLYWGWQSFLKRKSQSKGTSVVARRSLYFLFTLGISTAVISLIYWVMN